ncbi:nucleotide exchange factor GrpE [Butyrivibrio sp. FCS014]|uniref:nucleotide exchange factor GrpE n=1 Tax=Butyrivibrio sp. FCS014 TaxID=1408304 RepID=UPI00046607F9|nr:nucleotide exchange factor GrpE [Butyrivibrio sp. FCS014]
MDIKTDIFNGVVNSPAAPGTEPPAETSATPAPDAGSESSKEFAALSEKIDGLKQLFEDKIQKETHNNQLIDKLYADKKAYEEDIVAAITDPILMEIIRVIDEINEQLKYISEEPSDENYKDLLKRFKQLPLRLDDILYDFDVTSYSIEGTKPDAKFQRFTRVIETDNEELGGTVAEVLQPGYKKGDRVIRHQNIAIYKYTEKKGEN